MILVLSANCAVRHQFYPQWSLVLLSHIMSSKKHSNAAGLSSRGSASKRRMQLTSYLWKKNWNAMEKLWKSYGISFLGICTNPVEEYRFTFSSYAYKVKLYDCQSAHAVTGFSPMFSAGDMEKEYFLHHQIYFDHKYEFFDNF